MNETFDDDKLDFPEAPEFISQPPQYSLQEMIKLWEKMLPYWNEKRYQPGSPYLEAVSFEPFNLYEDKTQGSND